MFPNLGDQLGPSDPGLCLAGLVTLSLPAAVAAEGAGLSLSVPGVASPSSSLPGCRSVQQNSTTAAATATAAAAAILALIEVV